MTSTISSKGQLTVPKAVRDRLGLLTGTRVEFELVERGVMLRKGRKGGARPVDLVRGILTRRVSTDRVIDEMRGPGPSSVKRRR
jgi:antitoxin PrlF